MDPGNVYATNPTLCQAHGSSFRTFSPNFAFSWILSLARASKSSKKLLLRNQGLSLLERAFNAVVAFSQIYSSLQ